MCQHLDLAMNTERITLTNRVRLRQASNGSLPYLNNEMKSQKDELTGTRSREPITVGILIIRMSGDESAKADGHRQADENGDLWFFTDEFSEKTRDISRQPGLC
jgi:hypothetical protein